jgi:hypothetical protein
MGVRRCACARGHRHTHVHDCASAPARSCRYSLAFMVDRMGYCTRMPTRAPTFICARVPSTCACTRTPTPSQECHAHAHHGYPYEDARQHRIRAHVQCTCTCTMHVHIYNIRAHAHAHAQAHPQTCPMNTTVAQRYVRYVVTMIRVSLQYISATRRAGQCTCGRAVAGTCMCFVGVLLCASQHILSSRYRATATKQADPHAQAQAHAHAHVEGQAHAHVQAQAQAHAKAHAYA